MKTMDVTIVRIYLMESESLLNEVLSYLKEKANIRGISIFRAISGFGETGNHSSSLVDLLLNLPLAIEFFDSKEKIKLVLEHLSKTIKPEHIIFWDAKTNDKTL